MLGRKSILITLRRSIRDCTGRHKCRSRCFVGRQLGTGESLEKIKSLLSFFEVALVNRSVLESALRSGFSDYEDGVLHEAARHYGADCIVTRNVKDFKRAVLPVYTPAQCLAALMVGELG